MFKLIGTTLKITQGDTGRLGITVTGVILASGTKAQLTITDLEKAVKIQKIADFSSNAAVFTFATADTAEMPEGNYLWELRIVEGATVTEGMITAGTDICTPFEKPMPLCIIDALGDIGAAAATAGESAGGGT